MISVLQHPNKVSFSRNPVLFEFQTDSLYSEQGRSFRSVMQFNATKSAGSAFTLSWKGVTITFDFVNEPTFNNGRELPAYQSGSTSDWLDHVVVALEQNYYLASSFTIEKGTNQTSILFTSRASSSDFNITYAGTTDMSGVVWSISELAQDKVIRKNFALYFEIWVEREDRSAFDRYAQSTVEVDNDGKAFWNIQQYLTAILLQEGPVLPDLVFNGIVVDNRSVRQYYIRYAEMYGDPQRVTRMYQSETFTAVLGGFSDDYLHRKLPDFFTQFGLLEWMNGSGIQRFHKDQPAFGAIVNFDRDYSDVEVKCLIRYADRLEEEHVLFTLDEWKINSKLVVPMGIPNCLVNVTSRDNISGATTWIESEGIRITANFESSFDRELRPAMMPLLYVNSFGCFQTIYTYGKRTFSYDIDKTAEAFTTKVIPKPMEHTFKELGMKSRNAIKINSGFFPYYIIVRFKDFMLSTYKFVYVDEKWRPVVLDSNAVEESTDFENMKSISFALKFANEEFLWSK